MIRILLFGDIPGIPQLLQYLPKESIAGIVGASIRPQYQEELKKIAAGLKVPYIAQPKWNSTDYGLFVKTLQTISPDLLWVNSYSMIIREDVLRIPPLGGLNIHAALLPRNRGCNPTQWAILNGDHKTGVTLHVLDAGVDTGPIIDQRAVPIFFEDTWREVQERLQIAKDDLLRTNLPNILSGNWNKTIQRESLATVGRRRTKQDSLFTWSEPIVNIYNKVRALVPPLPSAYYLDADGLPKEISTYQTIWQLTVRKHEQLIGTWDTPTKQVRLRPLRKEDASSFYNWINKGQRVMHNDPYYPVTEVDHEQWVERLMTRRSNLVIFVIEEIESKQAIGSCQLFNINWIHRSAELQIQIVVEDYQGNCYVSQTVKNLCEFGFRELNLHRIYLHVFCTNQRTIREYEKCGFKNEGILRQAAFVDGNWLDILIMGLLKSDG